MAIPNNDKKVYYCKSEMHVHYGNLVWLFFLRSGNPCWLSFFMFLELGVLQRLDFSSKQVFNWQLLEHEENFTK